MHAPATFFAEQCCPHSPTLTALHCGLDKNAADTEGLNEAGTCLFWQPKLALTTPTAAILLCPRLCGCLTI
eukprot:1150554-Pelagomonas_calceolata.AAC.1